MEGAPIERARRGSHALMEAGRGDGSLPARSGPAASTGPSASAGPRHPPWDPSREQQRRRRRSQAENSKRHGAERSKSASVLSRAPRAPFGKPRAPSTSSLEHPSPPTIDEHSDATENDRSWSTSCENSLGPTKRPNGLKQQPTARRTSLSSSCHALPPTYETPDEVDEGPQRRPQSPHPADIAREVHEDAPPADPPESPGLAVGDRPGASATEAGELQRLVDAMHHEFQRLRLSKRNAEARAERLEAEVSAQREETGRRLAELERECERMRADVADSARELDRATRAVRRLEGENAALEEELARLRTSEDAAWTRAKAEERRATAAEGDCDEVAAALRGLTLKVSQKKELRKSTSTTSDA